ncbi:SAP domain-containing protein [Thermococcus aggregans]|uniref:SAP domain-containing protein n=1 Tax=Thermococcus aggregans TaxID=110163 RepID=A0A9E7SMU7_THEAG|nr:SAP domain-containing protein [Thermococcus aggregans]USS40073.1 SAP domain-containing protein [Thermococcus aggregans]
MRNIDLLIDILDTYFYKDQLQQLLEQAGLKKSGTKIELIERLLTESNYDLAYIFSRLTKDELLEILELYFDETLPKSTVKQEVIDRLVEYFEGTQKKDKHIQKEQRKMSKKDEIAFSKVYEILNEFGRVMYKADNEADLEKQLVLYLRSKLPSSLVTPQKAGAKRGGVYVPDIVIGNNLAIEIKYFTQKRSDDWHSAIGQVVRYKVDGEYERIILFILDKADNVPENYKEYEKLLPWLTIVVKK